MINPVNFSKYRRLVVFTSIACLTLYFNLFSELNLILAKIGRTNFSQTKPKACIIFLTRDGDERMFEAIEKFEKYFNHKHNYPYILFNNLDFSDEYKNEILKYTNSTVEFVKVSQEAWSIPSWVNITIFIESLNHFGIFPVDYFHMCRFYSGFFFREKATLKYDYYMRLDSDSLIFSEITEDPFAKFENSKELKYGFSLSVKENNNVIHLLWETIREWLKTVSPDDIPNSNQTLTSAISTDQGLSLTHSCVFYNNLEIASFDLFRNEQYLSYFDYLDKTGGFFYYRWGDAPVHTFYVSLMLKKSQVHLFNSILYGHKMHKNFKAPRRKRKKNATSYIYAPQACLKRWEMAFY